MSKKSARPPRRRTRPDREPSPTEQFDSALARLHGISTEASALFARHLRGPEPRATPGHEHVLGYLASWTRFVDRGISAVRTLQRSNLSVYAAPIRRNLLEHAVTCWTVADNADAFDSYIRTHKHSVTKVDAAMKGLGLESDEEAMERVMSWATDEQTKPLDNLAKSKVKFLAFPDGGDALYLQWLHETLVSHAGFPTAVLYLRDTPGDDYPTLTIDPMVTESEWSIAGTCADSILLCLQSFSRVIVGDPLGDEVTALNERKNAIIYEIGSLLPDVERLAQG